MRISDWSSDVCSQENKMVGIFLFVVTSHEDLGDTGNKTGSWLHELAAPYWRFRDAGYDVVIASPKGGMAPLDPTSLEESWISDAGRRFQADEEASADLANTRRLDDIEPAGYAGVFLVGGTATTWDFPGNAKKIGRASCRERVCPYV